MKRYYAVKIESDTEYIVNNEKRKKVTEKVTEEITDKEQKVIELLKKDSTYTTVMLAEMLGISRKTVSGRLKSMKDKGVIERIGSDRKGYWEIKI